LAHNWNAAIRRRSRGRFSLDNVMIDLFEVTQSDGTVIEARTLDKLIRPYLKRGGLREIKKYINSGALIRPDDSALGPCFELKTVEIRKFDLGFDHQASSSAKLVTGLRSDSIAFKAGLRNGQEIIGRRIFFDDPTRPAEIKVKNGDGEVAIQFLPMGETIRVPQYTFKLQDFKEEERACVDWFGL
jgi:predicted metalloprotease with PDZ domain